MVQGKTSPNKGLFAGLLVTGVLAIVIGCGGGGSSLTGTGTATATTGLTTSTASGTATTATGTVTGTSTASASATATGGTFNGTLPANVLIFNFIDPSDVSGQTVDVDYISADTSTTPQTSYAVFNNTSYALAAPNPVPGTIKGVKSTFAFVYTNPTTTLQDIWVGPSVSITTGTQITSSGFTSFGSLQYAPDGAHLVFVATNGSGVSQLFICNSDGTQLRFIDSADDAYLADDNVNIAYTKEDVNVLGQIWTVHLDGTNVKQITSDMFDHFNPQWSKDATRLAWSASPSGNGYDVYSSLPDGTQLNQVTNLQGDLAASPSFNNDGTQIGFVDISSTVTNSGVYYATINGLGLTQVVAQQTIQAGLYWTSANGTLSKSNRSSTPVFGRGYHISRLKKLGKWHWH